MPLKLLHLAASNPTPPLPAGDYKLFERWARRREAGGLPVTKRVSFVMAKGYSLMGDAKRAADILARGRAHFDPVSTGP